MHRSSRKKPTPTKNKAVPQLSRKQMLTAELFSYSYANYEDHLGIGNLRFDTLMPKDVDLLEQAEQEQWEPARIAQALEIQEDKVALWQRLYREAKDIVDAPSLVQSFRRGVRCSIQSALEKGLQDTPSIERLVTQVCYRAADLAFRLEMEGKQLSDYSKELREETQHDLDAMHQEIDQSIQDYLSSQDKGGAT